MTDATQLPESLHHLRSEIEALKISDDEARQRLESLIQAIERTIENPKSAGAEANLGERLKTSILRFEVSHPRLAILINEVMEQLGNAGI